MDKRGNFLLMILTLALAQSVAQEPVPAQCQPCHFNDHLVSCPGDQCPGYYRLTETAVTCQPPTTTTTTTATTAATAAATTASTNVTSDDENSPTESATTTVMPTTTTATFPPTAPAQAPSQNDTSSSSDTDVPAAAPSIAAIATNPTPTPTSTQRPLLCSICLENCRTCNGSHANDCLDCKKDHEFENSTGALKCVLKKKEEQEDGGDGSGVGIGVIAGASAGGGVALLVVVVVVVCVCCRRRRGRREMEGQAPGMLIMDDIQPPQRDAEKGDDRDKEEEVRKKPTKPGMDVPDYVNVASTMPRRESIERGHDKVTRYVRDPTVKKPESEPLAGAAVDGDAEKRELAELPAAPLPPPGGRKRSTDAGDPRRDHTTTTTTTHHPQAPRMRHTTPTKPATAEKTRHGRPGGGAMTLPGHSAAPGADSQLPRFPMEEELEREQQEEEEQRASGGKVKVPKPAAAAAAKSVAEKELEEPETDYANLPGAGEKLGEAGAAGARSAGAPGGEVGVVNPGFQPKEEPEDVYANQAAIEEALHVDDENPYQNVPFGATR